jgi:hypothetical protein
MADRTADEIARLRSRQSVRPSYWMEVRRFGACCPVCGRRYSKARPEWATCLACEQGTRGWEDGPIMRAKRDRLVERALEAFPAARELGDELEADWEPDPTLFDGEAAA